MNNTHILGILIDLIEVSLGITDLVNDGEFRIYFEFPPDHIPNLKALTALRALFGAMEEDLYLEPEPMDDGEKIHGYICMKYAINSPTNAEEEE